MPKSHTNVANSRSRQRNKKTPVRSTTYGDATLQKWARHCLQRREPKTKAFQTSGAHMPYFKPQPETGPKTWYMLDHPDGAQAIPALRAGAVSSYVDQLLTQGTVWRNSPLDAMRHVQIVGGGATVLRGLFLERQRTKSTAPMPQGVARQLAQQMASIVPVDPAPELYPVFEGVLIPLCLAIIFDPTLPASERLAYALEHFPEVDRCMGFIAARDATLLASQYQGEPSAHSMVTRPSGLLHWIGSALESQGCELSHNHAAALVYMLGTMGNALMLRSVLADELVARRALLC
jgi:hypothetical protein